MRHKIIIGDVREIAATLEAQSFDGCLCDPPYGLSFMGKKWDYDVPCVETWEAVLGALKPGAHLLAFAGTRTQHRMAVRIEDAGFEIRDMIAWVYGSGFPKSLDVSKAIDKAAGAEREVIGTRKKLDSYGEQAGNNVYGGGPNHDNVQSITAPATDAARQWSGYGTALKPALEPITVARKPLVGTVAANCLEYGTGAINVDGCRVEASETIGNGSKSLSSWRRAEGRTDLPEKPPVARDPGLGRWPANLIHDGSGEVLAGFPETTSGARSAAGSAARFFYCAKASRGEREAGLGSNAPHGNHHPTVKPIAIAEYLARLILPPKRDTPRRLLVPFSGSGSELIGALLAGWDEVVGIELSPEYAEIAEARITYWTKGAQMVLE